MAKDYVLLLQRLQNSRKSVKAFNLYFSEMRLRNQKNENNFINKFLWNLEFLIIYT